MQEKFLAPGGVLEANLVEAATTLGQGLDGGARGVGRQLVGRHVVGVVQAAHHDGPVRVAMLEHNQDFLAYPRKHEAAPARAGMAMGNAHPARALVVALAQPVPEEVHFDPAVLIGVDLVARRAHHQCRLRPMDGGARGEPRLAERNPLGDHRKSVAIGAGLALPADIVAAAVRDRQHQVLLVERGLGVALEGEAIARHQGAHVAAAVQHLVRSLLGLHLHLGHGFAFAAFQVAARVHKTRIIGVVADAHQRVHAGFQQVVRFLEVVVAHHHPAAAQVLAAGQ